MRPKCILAVVAGLLLAQCAARPPEAKTVYISTAVYESYTCPQLGQQADALSAKAAELSGVQDRRGSWVPFVGRDTQAADTRLTLIQGQLKAIEQARTSKKCL